jgi:regulator of sigma E protease
MDFILYYVLPFIFVLGVLIFFHELGHFLVAKSFGVKVLKFSLGFGPKLVGKQIGETEYLISSIPLGGYVKLYGESQDDEPDDLFPEDSNRSFSQQHALKRIAIVLAGPVFNFVLALLVFCFFFMAAGKQIMTPEIGQIRAESPADRAGLKKGDMIVSMDEAGVDSWDQIKEKVEASGGNPIQFRVKRGDDLLEARIVPESSTVKNIFGEEIPSYLIGVVAAGKYVQIPLSPITAVEEGARRTWEVTELTVLTIVKLIQRVVPIKTLGGPIMIGQMTGQIAREDLTYLIPFMAVISINLAVLNLLPIPILDGGLIFFLLIELITGKPIGLRKRDWAQRVGLFLLVLLMAFVIYNDITRILE